MNIQEINEKYPLRGIFTEDADEVWPFRWIAVAAEVERLQNQVDLLTLGLLREKNKTSVLLDALTRIEKGCSFPENDVEKAIRDESRKAIAAVSKIP